jgi:hypothetical protein
MYLYSISYNDIVHVQYYTPFTGNESRGEEGESAVSTVRSGGVGLHVSIEGKVDGRERNVSQETGGRTLKRG